MDIRNLEGSIVALVTPFKKDGSVDFDALERLIDFLSLIHISSCSAARHRQKPSRKMPPSLPSLRPIRPLPPRSSRARRCV